MFSKVPLFMATLDKKKYRKSGKIGCCDIKFHPYIKLLSEEIQSEFRIYINQAIDIIRDNLDVNKL